MQIWTTPEPLPRAAGWAALGPFVALVTFGVVYELPGNAALLIGAGACALAFGALAVLGPVRYRLSAGLFAGAAVTTICYGNPSNAGWFALLILLLLYALRAPIGVAAIAWLGVTGVFVVQAITLRSDPGWFSWMGGTAFTTIACILGRRQRELVEQLRAAQAGLAERAQAQERARIARELHDVIAHSLTVSLLHVSAARLALADDPADAARALEEAERLGRASLDEVRHAVGTLRTAQATDPRVPLPGSTDVPALVAGFVAAGADVRANVDADLSTLPATVGLATYRILQEALTNAVRHASSRPVEVQLRLADGRVRLDVDSAGTPGTGQGLGLLGMRERAEAIGGRCEAGPGGHGWLVHAELPIGAPR